MSVLPTTSVTQLGPALSAGGLPPIDPSREPASIRNGSAAAKKAYQAALGFEQILVDQLGQALAATVSGSSGDGTSGDGTSGDGANSSAGLMGTDPATSAYAGLLPEALTTSVMSSGGLGIAQQLAGALDPSITAPQPDPSAQSNQARTSAGAKG